MKKLKKFTMQQIEQWLKETPKHIKKGTAFEIRKYLNQKAEEWDLKHNSWLYEIQKKKEK